MWDDRNDGRMRGMMIGAALIGLTGLTLDPVMAQSCPDGREPFGSPGIGEYHCVGGTCEINEPGDPYAHTFTTEPRLRDIDPDGPSAGKLQSGDVLVAVDGVLITTPEGGRRLGGLAPGQQSRFTVRRDGRLHEVRIVPERSCELPDLEVSMDERYRLALEEYSGQVGQRRLRGPLATRLRSDSMVVFSDSLAVSYSYLRPDSLRLGQLPIAYTLLGTHLRETQPRVEFGLELTCGDCGWTGGLHMRRFSTEEFPVVESVEKGGPADEAGILPGDVLISVAGKAITSRSGGEALGSLEAGETVRLEIRRGDRIIGVEITPREASGNRQRM